MRLLTLSMLLMIAFLWGLYFGMTVGGVLDLLNSALLLLGLIWLSATWVLTFPSLEYG